MGKTLSPIKVKIGLRTDGRADYPNFNSITAVKDAGMDWSKYIDVHGNGWHYDQVSGHNDDDPDSPAGEQWGMLMVPKEFADDALTKFPAQCFALTEAEAKEFYDNRAHIHEADENINSEILNGLKLKQDLGGTLSTDQLKALDPNDVKPGVKKNHNRFFDDRKLKEGITFVKAAPIPIPPDPAK